MTDGTLVELVFTVETLGMRIIFRECIIGVYRIDRRVARSKQAVT